MPTATLKKVSKVCQLKMSSVEDKWNSAKDAAGGSQNPGTGPFYGVTMSIFKKKLSSSCLKKLKWSRTGKSKADLYAIVAGLKQLNGKAYAKRLEQILAAKRKELELTYITTHEGTWLADLYTESPLLKKFDFGPKMSYWYTGSVKDIRDKVKELQDEDIKIKNLKDIVGDLKGAIKKYPQPQDPDRAVYLYYAKLAGAPYIFGIRKNASFLKKFGFRQVKTYWRRIKHKSDASSVITDVVNSNLVTIINKSELIKQGLYIDKKTDPIIAGNHIHSWKDIRKKFAPKSLILLHSTILENDQAYQSVVFGLWEKVDRLVNKRLAKMLGENYPYVESQFEKYNYSLAGSTNDASDPSIIQAFLGSKKKVENLFQDASILAMPSLKNLVNMVIMRKKNVLPKLMRFASTLELFKEDTTEEEKHANKMFQSFRKLYQPWVAGSLSKKLKVIQ